MPLFERTEPLAELAQLRRQATQRSGRVVFVGGEAGIGKTSLLREFALAQGAGGAESQAYGAGAVRWGSCDPLHAPRPFGPLHDIAAELGHEVVDALAGDAARLRVFGATLAAVALRPCVVVIEDVHWADEATFDLLAYLGRRIERTHALLVLSYRDDEISVGHPLRRLLGTLAGAARISLAPLSLDVVREMAAGLEIDAQALHRATSGNPFFVTEVLACGGSGIPATVRDAVLARAAGLSAAARSVVEAAAVAGPRAEPWLLEAVAPADVAIVDECLGAGVLRERAGTIEFRHELARRVLIESLSAPRLVELHRRTLQALLERRHHDLARLAHHAEAAQDRDAVLRLAPEAARQAAAAGAHRQAHAQYARAVRHADALPDAERAALLEAFAVECQNVGALHEGVDAREAAIELRRRLGDVEGEADNLCQLAQVLTGLGRNADAEAACVRALALLEGLPAGRALARALRIRSGLHMLARESEEAIRWGDQALALAERLGDTASIASALNALGCATMQTNYEAGCALLERSRQAAAAAGLDVMARGADVNLGSVAGEVHRFVAAERLLAAAAAQSIEREIDPSYPHSWRAVCLVHLGRWAEAGELANEVLAAAPERTIARTMAKIALGRLRARRGDAGVWSTLDDALETATATGHLQRIAPVRAARAEAAWLAQDPGRCLAEARAAYAHALACRHAWFVGELAYWLAKAGAPVELPGYAARPYALQLEGDWAGAAAAWQALACPYERARALAEGDADAQRQALLVFDQLGARPAAAALRQTMRASGQHGVPRGPRASTRANAFGLTAREVDILGLVDQGLTNAQIGLRRHVSVRTVDHHVAAILSKMNVGSREAATKAAREFGVLPTAEGEQVRGPRPGPGTRTAR